MSDVSIAPPPAAPADAPAPAAHEVPINQNPVNMPAPVGSQAPEAPPPDKAPSRREALQAAFDRANKTAPKADRNAPRPAPKAAEARPGHNNPPEPTEGIDLKKRPGDQPQPRGERGQFAPRQAETAANDGQVRPPTGQQPQQQRPRTLPEHAPYREPPQRMAEHAKRDWDTAPESVRGEVYRMHDEFSRAYQRYKADHDVMNSIRPWQDMAAQHGTTLDRALNNYVTMEQKLRADPIGGLDVIVNNLNLRAPDGRKIGLRDIAYHILNQSPEQHKLLQQANVQQAASHQIGALHQEIAGLKNTLHQMHNQQQFTTTRSAVDQFADHHPRFDELGDLIEQELKTGYDLETAYRRAELLRPATHAAQTRTPSAQTRPTDRSISGAPGVTGSNPAQGNSRSNGRVPERREAIQSALRRVNGGL
jgi:hypothetical protein